MWVERPLSKKKKRGTPMHEHVCTPRTNHDGHAAAHPETIVSSSAVCEKDDVAPSRRSTKTDYKRKHVLKRA